MAPGEDEILINIVLIFIFIVATASNSLVLLVFYRRPGLRTLSNRFVINLLATNLLSCWVLLPLILVDSVWGKAYPGPGMCAVSQGASTGLCAASVMSVLLIGIDQYYAVIDPLHYHSHIDNPRCAMMTIVTWMLSLSLGIIGGAFYGASSFWHFCEGPVAPIVPNIFLSVFSVVYSVLVFMLPFSCLCWVYMSIYSAAHKNSQRTRRNGSSAGFYIGNSTASETPSDYSVAQATNAVPDSPKIPTKAEEPTDSSESNKPTLNRSPTRTSLKSTSSIVNSLRYRISNASMFKYREETRAARISALVIVMALVCWFPFTAVLVSNSPLVRIMIPHLYAKLSVTLLASTSIISTLIFAHRNRRIQRDLSKLFGLARHPTSSHGRQRVGQTQRNVNRVLPPNYSHNALEHLSSLAEAKDETPTDEQNFDLKKNNKFNLFFIQVLCNKPVKNVPSKMDIVADKCLISVPEIALDIDTSRSSFSSGGSSGTQRSTSAASISSVAEDF